jgi:hypothetical protein
VWTFTVETATHVLRLITSGLFDRFPPAHNAAINDHDRLKIGRTNTDSA